MLFLYEVGRKVNIPSKKSMISSEISKFRAKSQMFSARCQSKFDNSLKRNDILRKNIIGVVALLGTIGGIIRNNAVYCSE